MTTCTHSLDDQFTTAGLGFCPICQTGEIERLRNGVRRIERFLSEGRVAGALVTCADLLPYEQYEEWRDVPRVVLADGETEQPKCPVRK